MLQQNNILLPNQCAGSPSRYSIEKVLERSSYAKMYSEEKL